jgi:hypothetical protein
MLMVSPLQVQVDIGEIKREFASFDTDKDRSLTPQQFQKFLDSYSLNISMFL